MVNLVRVPYLNTLCDPTLTEIICIIAVLKVLKLLERLQNVYLAHSVHYTVYRMYMYSTLNQNIVLHSTSTSLHTLNPSSLLQTQSDSGNGYYNRRSSATPLAVILAPTRELALQIYDEARKVGHVLQPSCLEAGLSPESYSSRLYILSLGDVFNRA